MYQRSDYMLPPCALPNRCSPTCACGRGYGSPFLRAPAVQAAVAVVGGGLVAVAVAGALAARRTRK